MQARLQAWWEELEAFFREEVRRHQGSVQSYLQARNPVWNLVGRVYFHLAENKHDRDHPFAFLATYTTRLSGRARPQHQPLGQALRAFAGDRAALLSLLAPVGRAATSSPLLKDLVDTGDIFQPLAWTPREAHQFLQDVPALEAAGVIVRVPDWWRADRPRRLEVSVTVGGKPPATLGLDALLDFSVALTLDGEAISDAEWREILAGTDGLALVRGKWVELDREKLREVLGHWERARRAAREGLSFREAMRLLAGTAIEAGEPAAAPDGGGNWSRVVAGEWLATTLAHLRTPEGLAAANPEALRTALRPYQAIGVRWLWFLSRLGLGACLADDMGLGKTIQVLGLLLLVKRGAASGPARVQARRSPAPEPPRGAGFPDRQLAAGDPPVRTRSRGVRGPPVGAAELESWPPWPWRIWTAPTSSSPPTVRCRAFPGSATSNGRYSCSTRPRRSRTPPPSRREPSNASGAGPGWP